MTQMIYLNLDSDPNLLCIKHKTPMHVYSDGTTECAYCTQEGFAELSARLKREIEEDKIKKGND